ncbi:MAG: FHA domain-containing protein, partial [Clostridiaceae bacterium]|nr:FHA domain-containing protein [Clostridiaceae bacterium]
MNGLNKLKKEYMYDGEKSYLVVSVPVQSEIKHYQLEMLEKNNVEPLLPLAVQRFNEELRLYYEITSKIPIKRIFERRRINAREFEYIVMQFARLPDELKDFLLDISFVVLDESYIYCDPLTMKLYFLYIPIPICENEHDSFRQFIKRMIIDDISLMDDSSGNLLKRLLDVLKHETFSAEKLAQSIIADETCKKEAPAIKPVKEETEVKLAEYAVKERNDKTKAQDAKHRAVTELKYPLSSYLITAFLNAVLIAVLILSLAAEKNDDAGSRFLGIVLIAAAVNYFAVTRLFSKDKKTQKITGMTVNNKRNVNQSVNIIPKITNFSEKRLDGLETAAGTSIDDSGKGHATHEKPVRNYAASENTGRLYRPEINNAGCCNTVILGKSTGSAPYLQSLSNPANKIIIDKNSILIGRLKGSVDYVIDNKAVGKIHAEIVKKGEEFYIIDLNSVNGTYVNGERIVCNTETMIKNGDKIMLANEVYTFT